MAYWFHRNPLKATAKVNFELKLIVSDSQAVGVCRLVEDYVYYACYYLRNARMRV